MTSILGMTGCALVMVFFGLLMTQARSRSVRVRCVILLVMIVAMFIPVNGLIALGYVRGLIGDMSFTTWLLALLGIHAQLTNRERFTTRDYCGLMMLLIASSLFLYPFTLGLTIFDPYTLGYGSYGFDLALLLIALLAWWKKFNLVVLCLMGGIFAYHLNLLESGNLWDYLIDPISLTLALGWCVEQAFRKRQAMASFPSLADQTQAFTKIEIVTYMFVLVMVLIGYGMASNDEQMFEEVYVKEDGLIEWLTVLGFAIGSLVCFRRVFTLRSSHSMLFLGLSMMLGLAFLFVAGEEISWGQRLLNVESADFFRDHNAQEETNLHNLEVGGVKLNKLIFSKGIAVLMVLYFAVLAPLYSKKPRIAKWVDSLGIPIPKLHQSIACLIMLLITQLMVDSSNRGELAEFGGAFLFTIIVAYPSNHRAF
ncbi:MAG: hypothetical protein O7G85_08095, partial [Planctomycetota bacterium]|nr:hypothetical protein [Planctomycetota bacterium]